MNLPPLPPLPCAATFYATCVDVAPGYQPCVNEVGDQFSPVPPAYEARYGYSVNIASPYQSCAQAYVIQVRTPCFLAYRRPTDI